MIERIYICVAENENGEEGLIGEFRDGAWFPFYTSKESLLPKLADRCEAIQELTGKPYKILELSQRTDITSRYKEPS